MERGGGRRGSNISMILCAANSGFLSLLIVSEWWVFEEMHVLKWHPISALHFCLPSYAIIHNDTIVCIDSRLVELMHASELTRAACS